MDLVEQYNEIYRNKPDKWAKHSRDSFAFNHLSKYGEPKTMLDIGCGNGHTIAYLSMVWRKTKFTGLDLSDIAIDLARASFPSANFICGFLDDDVVSGKFDLITLLGVVEHFPTPLNALKQIFKLLNDGGHVYIEAPNCLEMSGNQEESFRVIENGSGQFEWHYKRETWEKIIRDAGFEIVENIKGQDIVTEFVWVLRKGTE